MTAKRGRGVIGTLSGKLTSSGTRGLTFRFVVFHADRLEQDRQDHEGRDHREDSERDRKPHMNEQEPNRDNDHRGDEPVDESCGRDRGRGEDGVMSVMRGLRVLTGSSRNLPTAADLALNLTICLDCS